MLWNIKVIEQNPTTFKPMLPICQLDLQLTNMANVPRWKVFSLQQLHLT